jgi:hypothetical protein
MTRRTHGHGEVIAWTTTGDQQIERDTVLVYCARGSIDTADGLLHPGDAWLFPSDTRAVLSDGAVALTVRIESATI